MARPPAGQARWRWSAHRNQVRQPWLQPDIYAPRWQSDVEFSHELPESGVLREIKGAIKRVIIYLPTPNISRRSRGNPAGYGGYAHDAASNMTKDNHGTITSTM